MSYEVLIQFTCSLSLKFIVACTLYIYWTCMYITCALHSVLLVYCLLMNRESMSIPQSLFWRRYTPDIMTTRIKKLHPQAKKVKGKADQFTPLLEGQVHYSCTQHHVVMYYIHVHVQLLAQCIWREYREGIALMYTCTHLLNFNFLNWLNYYPSDSVIFDLYCFIHKGSPQPWSTCVHIVANSFSIIVFCYVKHNQICLFEVSLHETHDQCITMLQYSFETLFPHWKVFVQVVCAGNVYTRA